MPAIRRRAEVPPSPVKDVRVADAAAFNAMSPSQKAEAILAAAARRRGELL